ncbi:MAG: hypothetical protein A2Z18_07510 [Armatimonadetes bacterium RBG_16_58_9]|nr:MAG: hypothetical protein A2Z18_07510 [Armatimonadetes bacterium RBG_16_58_9]
MSKAYTILLLQVSLSLTFGAATAALADSSTSSLREKVAHAKWSEIDTELAHGNSTMPGPEAIIRSVLYDSGGFCADRELENVILAAEMFSAIAAHWRLTYPRSAFQRSWRECCSGQNPEGFAEQTSTQALPPAYAALDRSLEALAKHITTKCDGIPIIVFNPLSWTRTDAVCVESPFSQEKTAVKITDPDGRTCAARNIGDLLYFTARDVPGIGYKVFRANRADKPPASGIRAAGTTIENQFFSVYVDKELGVVRRIHDKRAGRDVMPNGAASALLRVVGSDGGGEDLVGNTEVVLVDTGPARATISFDHEYGDSQFNEELTLYDDVPRIDLHITADWRQASGAALKAAFQTKLIDPKVTFELPFGVAGGPASAKPYPALNWIDLNAGRYGVGLVADAGCGYEIDGSTVRAVLIGYRESGGQSVREFTLSLFPHNGDWRRAGLIGQGLQLGRPLIARLAASHAGSLPRSQSFVSVSSPAVIATALKQEENDTGTILRLRETRGEPCETLIRVRFPAQYYIETDALENPIGKKGPLAAGRFTVKFAPNEVRTFKLLRR